MVSLLQGTQTWHVGAIQKLEFSGYQNSILTVLCRLKYTNVENPVSFSILSLRIYIRYVYQKIVFRALSP